MAKKRRSRVSWRERKLKFKSNVSTTKVLGKHQKVRSYVRDWVSSSSHPHLKYLTWTSEKSALEDMKFNNINLQNPKQHLQKGIFSSFTFFFHSFSFTEVVQLKNVAKHLGATVVDDIGSKVTHVITRIPLKLKETKRSILTISPKWILDCAKSHKLISPFGYLITSSNTTTIPENGRVTGSGSDATKSMDESESPSQTEEEDDE